MILILHIIIALATVSISIYTVIHPTKSRIHLTSYGALLTLVSGTTLVVSGANFAHACASGCLILGISFALQSVARYRLRQMSA